MSWLSDLLNLLKGKRKPPASVPPPAPFPSPNPDSVQAALLAGINAARVRRSLPPLSVHPSLTAEVRLFAGEIATLGQLTHRGLDGSWPWDRAEREGYPSRNVSECIAAGQTSAAQAVTDWMNDPPHRDVILGPWLHFGGAVASGSPWGLYWVTDFGSTEQTREEIALPGGRVRMDQSDGDSDIES